MSEEIVQRGRGEEGRAVVEFVFLGILLLLPLTYLVLTLARVVRDASHPI